MSATAPVRRLTEAAYLDFERKAEMKHEFFDGELFAMSGGTRTHSLVAANLIAALHGRLKNRCQTFTSDLRVKIEMTGLYTYPDVSVACGEQRFADDQNDVLLTPTLVVEVLSESTEAYDRGKKFEHYRRIPSLQGYLLVRQEYAHLELFSRQSDGTWRLSEASGMAAELQIPALEVALPLKEVYLGVNFPPATGSTASA